MTIRRIILLAALALWTWLLLKPEPVPEFLVRTLMDDVKYIASKCLHFSVYAAFAWYGSGDLPPRGRRWFWALLLLHGAATELGQYYGNLYLETQRTGTVRDAIINACGIAAGAYWRSRRTESAVPPNATEHRAAR